MELPYYPREDFHPTPVDLIAYYLKNHIIARPYRDSDVIQSATIFGDHLSPWQRFCTPEWQWRTDLHDTPVLYLFTKLSNIGKTSRSTNLQKKRTAGCGSWHGSTKPIKVKSFDDMNLVIGYYRRLTFRAANEEQTVGQWNMCEYSICGEAFPQLQGLDWEDWVVCCIKRDDTKYSIGAKVFEAEEEEVAPVAKKVRLDNGDQAPAVDQFPTVDDGPTVDNGPGDQFPTVHSGSTVDDGGHFPAVEWEELENMNLMFNLDDLLNPLPQDWIELDP